MQPLQHGSAKGMIWPAKPPLREADCRRAHITRHVIQGASHIRRLDGIDPVQRPQRVEAHTPIRCTLRQLRERRNHRPRPAFDEQTLRVVAPPAVRMRERRYELRWRRARQCRECSLGPRGLTPHRLVHHAIDPAQPDRLFQLALENLIAKVFRHRQTVFENSAIHVHDVQGAVGRIGEIDGAEALVGRGQELTPFVRLARSQRRAVVAQDDAAHHIGGRLRHEDISVEIRRQPIAAVHHRSADGREPGERPVGTQDAELIGAVGRGRGSDRPDGVQLGVVVRETFVAPARAEQIRIAGEID